MAPRRKKAIGYYNPAKIVDAPEYYSLSRAMGILTWSTWDQSVRPAEDRVAEFLATFPPADPTCHLAGSLVKTPGGMYDVAPPDQAIVRFLAADGRVGSLHELLARYGLKMTDGPAIPEQQFDPGSFLVVTRRRNHKLRVLHGGVDVEPDDMDAAKAEYLDRQEKQQAATEVRAARKRMQEELVGKKSEE